MRLKSVSDQKCLTAYGYHTMNAGRSIEETLATGEREREGKDTDHRAPISDQSSLAGNDPVAVRFSKFASKRKSKGAQKLLCRR